MLNKKILIDAFGADAPDLVIDGIAKAINAYSEVEIVAVGKREYIENRLIDQDFDRNRLEIIDAEEVVTNDDGPVESIRKKRNSSLYVGMTALKDRHDIGCMITAGNTGAVIAGSVLILGRETDNDRPTLVTLLPNDKGGITCLADCGANVDCKPHHLLKFAEYANDYAKGVLKIEEPKVALLSVGTEDKKGNMLTKETFKLLKESGLNFIGNMEAKTALSGDVDVIVADGFYGNVLLKSIEGTAKSVLMRMLKLLKKNAGEKDDFTFVNKAVKELLQQLDFNSMGGAILLGVKKPIIKAHGSANSDTVINTVNQAISIIKTKEIL